VINITQNKVNTFTVYAKGTLAGTIRYLLEFENKATGTKDYCLSTNAADSTCPFLVLSVTEAGRTGTEDKVNGKLKLTPAGGHTLNIYEQSSLTNLAPALATKIFGIEEVNIIRDNDDAYT